MRLDNQPSVLYNTVVGKDAMVLAAYEEGIVKSAAQRDAELVLPE